MRLENSTTVHEDADAIYKTDISDARWIAYDIPGNIGWITYLAMLAKMIRKELSGIVRDNADSIEDIVIENDCRNSAVHLLDIKDLHARIEPGAFIREHVEIGKNAVIMMGDVEEMEKWLGAI